MVDEDIRKLRDDEEGDSITLEVKRNRLLIICNEGDYFLAEHFSQYLKRELPDFCVKVSTSLSSEERNLEKHKYNWLLIWELVSEEVAKVNHTSRWAPNGIVIAQEWLKDHAGGRAIVMTESLWEDLRGEFVDRLSAIPAGSLSLGDLNLLIEIIHAGQAGYTLIPPTVVEFELRKKERGCVLSLHSKADGPLRVSAETSLRGQRYYAEVQYLGNFDDVASAFHRACSMVEPGERRQAVLEASKRLWPEGKRQRGDLLSLFLETVEDSLKLWKTSPAAMNPNAPFPIHLHLLCDEAEMLAIPVDLILRRTASMEHICAHVPVVWRITTGAWKCNNDAERNWNRTNYDRFVVIYSCSEESQWEGDAFPPVEGAHAKAEKILKRVGKEEQRPIGVMDQNALRRVFTRSDDHHGSHAVHVISHGTRAHPADLSSVLVGPDNCGEAIPVTANNLSPNPGVERGPNFVYFNCCELGHQGSGCSTHSSYAGGFAEGAIGSGLCYEIISNRWGVNQGWAHEMELAFYKTRPCTTQSRAVALLRARLKTWKKMKKKTGEGQFDPTWLAPVHVWADTRAR